MTSSRTPVFLVNSRQALFAATPFRSSRKGLHVLGAPLLPKLRGQVAEFLRGNSLARLSILCPSTCVGLRYGQPGFNACEAISWQHGPGQFSPVRGIPIASQSWVFKPAPRISLERPPTGLDALSHQGAGLSLLRHPPGSTKLAPEY